MISNKFNRPLRFTIHKWSNLFRNASTQEGGGGGLTASNVNQVPDDDLSSVIKLPAYSTTERAQILNVINDSTVEQLLRYDITKARANKLQSWRTRNGRLDNLGDILYIEGFGLKAATKFYKSLLETPASDTDNDDAKSRPLKQVKRTAPFITPSLDDAHRERIRSSVGVRIGVTCVSWARLQLAGDRRSPTELTHWQHQEFNDKKLHLAELAQRCLYMVHQIPTADCYVIENPQMAQATSNPGSIDHQNVNIQRSQVTAILSYALLARAYADAAPNNLFYMRRFLTARLFNHLVGTERISSEDTILTMMRTHYNSSSSSRSDDESLNLSGQVNFPQELREMFSKVERYQRELLGQSLLLNLAFLRLVLLKDEASIAVVSRFSKKTPNNEEVVN